MAVKKRFNYYALTLLLTAAAVLIIVFYIGSAKMALIEREQVFDAFKRVDSSIKRSNREIDRKNDSLLTLVDSTGIDSLKKQLQQQ